MMKIIIYKPFLQKKSESKLMIFSKCCFSSHVLEESLNKVRKKEKAEFQDLFVVVIKSGKSKF